MEKIWGDKSITSLIGNRVFTVKQEKEREKNALYEETIRFLAKLNASSSSDYPPRQLGRLQRELKVMGVKNVGDLLALEKQCDQAPCRFGQAFGQRLKTAKEKV